MPKDIRKWTDNELAKMERKITRIYRTSAKDIKSKWDDFMEEAGAELKPLQSAYDDAVKSGDEKLIKEAGKKLSQAQREVTLQNDYYKEMIDETTLQLAHVNQTAVSYMNGQIPSIYTNNYNDLRYDADNLGIMFNIQNEETVRNLMNQGEIELPKRKLEVPKDRRWNRKQLNSSVLQGIIQGESMDEIAKRILPVVDRNEASAIRNARTMVTGAENKGKQDSFKELQKQGAVLVQIWSAVGDSRTRDWHLSMDGQERELDEKFVDGIGNELRFPGDPRAEDGATIYNCRCAIKTRIIGFRKADGRIEYVNYERGKELSLHDKQIIEERQKRLGAKAPQQKVVNGKDISGTWVRRPNKFDFEIEDVINAQGFDGLPKVMQPKEFKQAVEENQIIFNRGYTAPSQESLDKYHEELLGGKWYVQCSGGSMNGYGMYTAGNYGTTLSQHSLEVAESYSNGLFGRIETMSLEKGAKIINSNDIFKLKQSETANYFFEKLSEEGVKLSPVQTEMAKMRCGLDVGDIWERYSPEEMKAANQFLKQYYDKYINDAFEYYGKFQNMDQGVYAALKGYDALEVDVGGNNKHFIILNRTKLFVRND